MNKCIINIGLLFSKYRGFAFVSKGAELCGFNKEKMECVVIDDGMCISDKGMWYVHHYKLNNSYDLFSQIKINDEEKISEEWVELA